METAALFKQLDVAPERGLSAGQARERLRHFGRNQLGKPVTRSAFSILANQFKGLIVALLLAAAVLALVLGDLVEGVAILLVLLINAVIGFVTEWRATRSMEALRQLGQVETRVRRGGQPCVVDAQDLVPGDIVLLEAGDLVSADLRIVEGAQLAANESALTGESVPSRKNPETLGRETPLLERSNMLFKGTTLTRGSGLGVVTATGTHTELGEISELVRTADAGSTPLEQRLNALAHKLVWVCLGLSALIALAGILTGRDWVLAVEVAIALAVAAIPEGLPIVATIALARGMWRMAQRQALITRLSAVETLGATGVILTDKTGTLTESKMTVTRVQLPDALVNVSGTGLETQGTFKTGTQPLDKQISQQLDELLTTALLCNNASLDADGNAQGDPTEIALLVAAAKKQLEQSSLTDRYPEQREEPFDPEIKAMATFNDHDGQLQIHVKGAPESVLDMCTQVRSGESPTPLNDSLRQQFKAWAEALASQGLRTLMLARGSTDDLQASPWQGLQLLGIVGLLDPPRRGVREAIERCHGAGVKVVMVTGDHAATALNVAQETSLAGEQEPDLVFDASRWPEGEVPLEPAQLESARVFARAAPRRKLSLITHYQAQDQVVAMTGDGVNDAPALKQADIGIAMGLRGTQVARDASAMVLLDDNFGSIVEAIAQGRNIYANLRKFVIYLLSCNISEIMVIGLATAAGAPLPLLPLQILFLNLVTDVFPALALGVGKGHPELMQRPPRPASEQILETRHWRRIGVYGLVMALSVLAAMAVGLKLLGLSTAQAVTVSFFSMALGQLWHVFNMRDRQAGLLRNEVSSNVWVWIAILICLALLSAAMLVPLLREVLQLAGLPPTAWLLVLAASAVPLLLGPIVRRMWAVGE